MGATAASYILFNSNFISSDRGKSKIQNDGSAIIINSPNCIVNRDTVKIGLLSTPQNMFFDFQLLIRQAGSRELYLPVHND